MYNREDLKREKESDLRLEKFSPHHAYLDKKFIEIIKNSKADYLIWFFRYKSLFIDGKKFYQPKVCIFDIKKIKENGHNYDHSMMLKITEEV